MTPCLVFDLETIPDVEGLRGLHGWSHDVPDDEVAARAFAMRKEQTGNEFLPLHLQKIAVIGCVFRDDLGFRVRCLGKPDDTEPVLIQSFFKTIERYTPRLISWNGSGFDLPVLHYRALIHGIQAARYWDMGEDDREFKYNNYLSRYHTRHIDSWMSWPSTTAVAMPRLTILPSFAVFLGSWVWTAAKSGRHGDKAELTKFVPIARQMLSTPGWFTVDSG